MRSRWALALLPAALLSCSDASLYMQGMENREPDRLAVTGRVCTDDARTAGFPIRVLFVVDNAAGPLFTDFDPELSRLRALTEAVSLHSGNTYSFAVAGFGARASQLAPTTGGFTANPGALDNGFASLSLPQACLGDTCRSYGDAVSLTRNIVEGDLANLPRGERLRTQYIVVWVSAGAPQPLVQDWGTTVTTLTAQVADLRRDVEAAGALSFSLHTLYLAAEGSNSDRAKTEALLQQLAFVGAGRFERFNVADAITLERIGLLKLSTVLQGKSLLVTNDSALPNLGAPLPDSDGDGLSDATEAELGSDPTLRDSDGDGVGDLVELLIAQDLMVANDPPRSCGRYEGPPYADQDLDGLNDCEEALLGTDWSLPDTDGDTIPDRVEVVHRTDYLRADLLDDMDWDGASNGDELLNHTDPGSADATSHLSDSYRYELLDEGIVQEPVVTAVPLHGVVVREAGPALPAGVGVLTYTPSPPTLSWRGPLDPSAGPPVVLDGADRYLLRSSRADAHLIADVNPALLPPEPVQQSLYVELVDKSCWQYTVRNIRLVETLSGLNNINLWFSESPQGQLTRPGLYRVANLPVTYTVADGRHPSAPLLSLTDASFVSTATLY